MSYQSVPTSEAVAAATLSKGFLQRFLEGRNQDETAVFEQGDKRDPSVAFNVHPEAIRIVSYLSFWAMVALAIIVTGTGVYKRDGLKVDIEESDLVHVFGYNNICVYWDYTPSREVVGMIYPIFEYSFVVYHVLSYLQALKSFSEGSTPYWLMLVAKIFLPVKLILTAWFRMIFIVSVEDSVPGHTYGFFGMQLALILVALENILYQHAIGLEYPILGRRTRLMSWVYFIILVPVTIFKISFVLAIFVGRPFIDLKIGWQVGLIHTADRLWMLLVAILPVPLAYVQMGKEPKLQIKIY